MMKSVHLSRICLALIIAALSAHLPAQTTAEQADTHFQAQEWAQAVEAYRALSGEEGKNGFYWFRLGQSLYQLQQHQAAVEPLQQALKHPDENVPVHINLLFLARSQAASANKAGALESLAAIEATGATPYLAVKNSTEFADFSEDPAYLAALQAIKPCETPDHRAFDFWVGDWEVTSPTRPGWTAHNSITVSNDGCSVHESYTTPGGYAGQSINFYDSQKEQWHQTWIDNQGASIYLEGDLVDGAMVLTNETNRVTWSVEPDGRVRQHWEVTSDGGESWSTAFDGYYSRGQ